MNIIATNSKYKSNQVIPLNLYLESQKRKCYHKWIS